MYWPAFQFNYHLDIRRLMPHIAAVEAYKQAAFTAVLPPQWREQTSPDSTTDSAKRNAAQSWVKQRFVPGSGPLTLADILTMHRLVAEETKVDNQADVWRTDPVQVGRREVGGIHMGAPAERLPLLMDQYIQFINSQQSWGLPPVMHALLAHFFFVTLHPFADGNGRTSRLVATAILYQRGYNVHGGFYALSDYFYQNDGIQYHTLLHRCWQQGVPFDLTPFVAFGMEGLVMELRSIDSFIKMKLDRIVNRDMLPPRKRRGRRRHRKLNPVET
jgi:hypothetical protein